MSQTLYEKRQTPELTQFAESYLGKDATAAPQTTITATEDVSWTVLLDLLDISIDTCCTLDPYSVP